MTKDPFGFEDAALLDPERAAGGAFDLTAFAPRPRPVDRPAVDAARDVAREAGFTRRTAEPRAPEPSPSSLGKGRKRRVNIAELLGIEDRYPDTERAQLNMLAPVPIVLRWRAIVQAGPLPAWEVLEAAMDALEKSNSSAPEGGT